jgi:hypothetical protein
MKAERIAGVVGLTIGALVAAASYRRTKGVSKARSCEACGAPLVGRQQRWCSSACKKRAYRSRQATGSRPGARLQPR